MLRKAAPLLLLSLACVLAASGLAGCGRATSEQSNAGGPDVGETVKALGAFTEELTNKVEKAEDTKAGLAEAQKLLDARKSELTASVAAARAGQKAKQGGGGSLLEAEVDDTERVHRLQVKYADAAAGDSDLKARLDKLVADYDSIFK